jgi:vesicle-fusing ATPase
MSLKIVSVPTDAHGETNTVYVNPGDGVADGSFIEIGGFIFTVRHEPTTERGCIAMNLMQRRCARVTVNAGDRATLPAAGQKFPTGIIANMKLEIEYVSAAKKGGVLDYMQFWNKVKSFAGQYLKEGQQLLIVVDGVKYIGTVTNMVAVTETDVATLTADTVITLSPNAKCEIQLTNVPDAIADAQLPPPVKDFNLEKLGIGGLRAEFGQVFRRAFASRIFPQSIVKKLGIHHVKGLLLFGPPGTGKTLIARKIGEILNCKEPKIVNGPEIFSKFVGQAEENVRKLFADAEADQAKLGDKSPLHLIIFDEFDAICKQRGAVRDSTGVSDNVVNQLLSKIDGVNRLNNVLLIGMTNRKDLIDEAILRPGRFEVHVEIGLPEEPGREEILKIHTKGMRDMNVLAEDVDLHRIAVHTKNFSGAELEGLVRSAQSVAFSRHIDFDNPTEVKEQTDIKITMADFNKALEEVRPSLGRSEDECEGVLHNGIIDYGADWTATWHRASEYVRTLHASPKMQSLSVLLYGSAGSGKSALAAHLAMSSEFPFVKFLTSNNMVGYGEVQKSNIFRKAFDDAFKSKLSVVVLDDIERLVEYSHLGGRYSNILLQTLMVLIKRPPPEGKKILIVGTTTNRDVMEALELTQVFSAEMELPLVPPEALPAVVQGLGVEWESKADIEPAIRALVPTPMKRLVFLIEMAATQRAGDDHRTITHRRLVDAMLNTGIGN